MIYAIFILCLILFAIAIYALRKLSKQYKTLQEIPIKKNCIEATKNTVIIIILRYASFTSALALFILDKIGYVTR